LKGISKVTFVRVSTGVQDLLCIQEHVRKKIKYLSIDF
jgi:hypothetical protein